ncbi:hypothetical protein HK099_004083 [Clydaea vesicula]|uniref:Uncharacterized protein n=1 Tax=Clydaea vesicula TaxID=447962 RepID=A0AAD5U713_9FUNG|nr:hypothetical protein HK099_004083 [Clydaea vesicula]
MKNLREDQSESGRPFKKSKVDAFEVLPHSKDCQIQNCSICVEADYDLEKLAMLPPRELLNFTKNFASTLKKKDEEEDETNFCIKLFELILKNLDAETPFKNDSVENEVVKGECYFEFGKFLNLEEYLQKSQEIYKKLNCESNNKFWIESCLCKLSLLDFERKERETKFTTFYDSEDVESDEEGVSLDNDDVPLINDDKYLKKNARIEYTNFFSQLNDGLEKCSKNLDKDFLKKLLLLVELNMNLSNSNTTKRSKFCLKNIKIKLLDFNIMALKFLDSLTEHVDEQLKIKVNKELGSNYYELGQGFLKLNETALSYKAFVDAVDVLNALTKRLTSRKSNVLEESSTFHLEKLGQTFIQLAAIEKDEDKILEWYESAVKCFTDASIINPEMKKRKFEKVEPVKNEFVCISKLNYIILNLNLNNIKESMRGLEFNHPDERLGRDDKRYYAAPVDPKNYLNYRDLIMHYQSSCFEAEALTLQEIDRQLKVHAKTNLNTTQKFKFAPKSYNFKSNKKLLSLTHSCIIDLKLEEGDINWENHGHRIYAIRRQSLAPLSNLNPLATSNLLILNLSRNSKITSNSIINLQRLKKLITVDLSETKITKSDFFKFFNEKQYKRFNCDIDNLKKLIMGFGPQRRNLFSELYLNDDILKSRHDLWYSIFGKMNYHIEKFEDPVEKFLDINYLPKPHNFEAFRVNCDNHYSFSNNENSNTTPKLHPTKIKSSKLTFLRFEE